MRRAFTLTELLFVMAIVAILAGLGLAALSGATQQARIERTRAIINRLDKLISEKYDSYRTRAVPIRIPAGTNPRLAAEYRLNAMRELIRCEMPDRISDLCLDPEIADLGADGQLDAFVTLPGGALDPNVKRAALPATPAAAKSYRRRAASAGLPWTDEYEGAECLYMIVASMRDGEDSALDFFAPSEIGDADADGRKEILDAFGSPIEFLRWPRGYVQENEVVTPLASDWSKAPDPFDPLRIDFRWSDNDPVFAPFAMKPLVFSTAGDDPELDPSSAYPNEPYDLRVGRRAIVYVNLTPPNDPYYDLAPPVGAPMGFIGRRDFPSYITNHDLSGDK